MAISVDAMDRTIYGAFPGEIQELPDPSEDAIPSRGLVSERVGAWVNAQKGADKKAAQEIRKLIQHVSDAQFATDLRACVQKAAEKGAFLKRNIVFVEPGKSQTYCVALIRDFLISSCLLKIGEQGANCFKTSLEALEEKGTSLEGISDFFFIDDASFTGLQMSANLSGAAKLLQGRFLGSSLRFHVIVPYMTVDAMQEISGLISKIRGVSIEIYTSSTRINTVKDLPKGLLEAAKKLLGVREDRSVGFLYTDLKIPNSMSFPEVLAGFVPGHPPVYKQPPFTVAEEECEGVAAF